MKPAASIASSYSFVPRLISAYNFFTKDVSSILNNLFIKIKLYGLVEPISPFVVNNNLRCLSLSFIFKILLSKNSNYLIVINESEDFYKDSFYCYLLNWDLTDSLIFYSKIDH